MGLIKSQSIYSTIISYVGVVIGFVTSALIMPKVLTSDQLGLTKLVVAVTSLFAMVFSLGSTQVMFRLFGEYYETPSKAKSLFLYTLKLAFLGCLIASIIYYFSAEYLFNNETNVQGIEKSKLFYSIIYITILARILYLAMNSFLRMTGLVSFDFFIQNIFIKGGTLALILLFTFSIFNFQNFFFGSLFIYLTTPLLIVLFLFKKNLIPKTEKKYTFSKIEKKKLRNLSLFGLITSIGNSLYIYLDTLMVNHYLTESEVGVYATLYLFGVVVLVPARALRNATVSVFSKSFAKNDLKEVDTVYKKSSITLFIAGIYLFIGIFSNRYTVFSYLPDEFIIGTNVILFIGLAQVYDMLCGVNYELIGSSKHYRINTLYIILTIATAIVLNIIFIPVYGITGAALATFCAIVLINSFRLLTVYRLFKILPFTKQTLKVLIIGVVTFSIVELIPNLENIYLNLLLKGGVVSIFYIPVIYFTKVSSDINSVINKLLKI